MPMNPIPIIAIVFLLKTRGNIQPPAINTLELEAFLDNARSMLNTFDKISGFAQSGLPAALPSVLPDMKKIMEIVDKLPL